MLRLLLPLLLLVWILAGCGYKGNLYLPDQSPDKTEHTPSGG
ncbi:MAG: lipoprotein [Magnetococcales bacterium]|nr:lipoprotein [Magnetococcales bacterium]